MMTRNRLVNSQERLVMTGKTTGSQKDSKLGQTGLASITMPSQKMDPQKATDQGKTAYPQGSLRGGG